MSIQDGESFKVSIYLTSGAVITTTVLELNYKRNLAGDSSSISWTNDPDADISILTIHPSSVQAIVKHKEK